MVLEMFMCPVLHTRFPVNNAVQGFLNGTQDAILMKLLLL